MENRFFFFRPALRRYKNEKFWRENMDWMSGQIVGEPARKE